VDTEKFLKILSERNREIGRYFGIKGSAVSEVIKGVEGRLGEEFRLRKEIESLKEKLIIDF
jgi:hypothetical protein